MRHEETLIYEKCLALMRVAQEMIEQFPKGFSFLADQLRRNTSSVTHNYAEGYYQHSTRQQHRFFDYAIQSAREASASFDTGAAFKAARPALVARLQASEAGVRLSGAQVSRFSGCGLKRGDTRCSSALANRHHRMSIRRH